MGRKLDYVLLTRRAHFLQGAKCEADHTLPLRRAGTKEGHRALRWAARRGQLLPTDRSKKAKGKLAEKRKSITQDRAKIIRTLRKIEKASVQTRKGKDVEDLDEALEYRAKVLAHLAALGSENFDNVDIDTKQAIVERALFDASAGIFELGQDTPRR